MKATAETPVQIPEEPGTYRVTVTGLDIASHRRLASQAWRSFAQGNKIGRASIVSSYGTHHNGHGVSHFNFRVTAK